MILLSFTESCKWGLGGECLNGGHYADDLAAN